jgi:hypothetical protein
VVLVVVGLFFRPFGRKSGERERNMKKKEREEFLEEKMFWQAALSDD